MKIRSTRLLFEKLYRDNIDKQRILLISSSSDCAVIPFMQKIYAKYNKGLHILPSTTAEKSFGNSNTSVVLYPITKQIFSTYYEVTEFRPHIIIFLENQQIAKDPILEKQYTKLIQCLPKAGKLIYFEQDRNFINAISKLGFMKDVDYIAYKALKVIRKNDEVFVCKGYNPLIQYSVKKIKISTDESDLSLEHTLGVLDALNKEMGWEKNEIFSGVL